MEWRLLRAKKVKTTTTKAEGWSEVTQNRGELSGFSAVLIQWAAAVPACLIPLYSAAVTGTRALLAEPLFITQCTYRVN